MPPGVLYISATSMRFRGGLKEQKANLDYVYGR